MEPLAHQSDEEIDYSDAPATSAEDWKEAVRGPLLPLVRRTITLALDAEVYDWLQSEGKSDAFGINFALRRHAQRELKRKGQPATGESSFSKAS